MESTVSIQIKLKATGQYTVSGCKKSTLETSSREDIMIHDLSSLQVKETLLAWHHQIVGQELGNQQRPSSYLPELWEIAIMLGKSSSIICKMRNQGVTFHSYVKQPEGTFKGPLILDPIVWASLSRPRMESLRPSPSDRHQKN